MSRQKALIVDDEPDIRELLEITLGRMKLDTRSARNVKEARELLAREPFDLCLTDMRLADAPGASQEGAASLSEIDNLEDYLEDIERKLIMQALEETRWNRTAAAQRLGLTFRSMRYRLKKLGID